jgi:hypothetical protein
MPLLMSINGEVLEDLLWSRRHVSHTGGDVARASMQPPNLAPAGYGTSGCAAILLRTALTCFTRG